MDLPEYYYEDYDVIEQENVVPFTVDGMSGYVSYCIYEDDGYEYAVGQIYEDVNAGTYLGISFLTNAADGYDDIEEIVGAAIITLDDMDTTTISNEVYSEFVGEYSNEDEDEIAYLEIEESPDVISFRMLGAKDWTKTEDWKVIDEDTLEVTCQYYHSEAENEDEVVFRLEKYGDSVFMTIVESEFPLLEAGEIIVFDED